MEWFKTPKVQALTVKWYAKLKKKGFVDIEHSENNLKQFSGKTTLDKAEDSTLIKDHWKYSYYQQCREFLGKYKFKNKTEKKIFEMHTEGLGVRVIAKELKTYRRKVHETVQRIVRVMRGK